MKRFLVMTLAVTLVAGAWGVPACAELVITEAVPSPGGLNVALQGMDWWELTNTGPNGTSLDGFEWVDRPVDNNQTGVFPTGVSVASGESVIILRGTAATETEFRTDWSLSPSVQILTEDQFTGLDQFSGLGSTSELIHLYDGAPPTFGTANLLASAPTGIATTGVSFEWGTNTGGTLGRLSVGGQNGAITLGDGRVASPGFATLGPAGPHIVFSDTFELSALALPLEPNLNAESPLPRQTLATSSYDASGSGAAIEQDAFGIGDGDWLALTANSVSGGATVDLHEDFAPSVAGKRYSVSYESRMDVPLDVDGNVVADFWQGFSVADDGPAESVNGFFTDFGILFRPNGDWSVFLDGEVAVGSGLNELLIDTGIRSGEFFDVEFVFDETLASPTVTGTVTTATLGSVVLGTLALDTPIPNGTGTAFEDISRFYELRTFLDAANAPAGEDFSNRFDNLTIAEIGLTADFNDDGVVDGSDLLAWESGFGTGATRAEGDADDDGDVDGQDFLLWQKNLGTTAPAVSAAVPEPTGCALAMMALAVVAGMHRRCLEVS